MVWRGGGRGVAAGKEGVREGLYKRKREREEDEQLHFFILYGKKGGEEVDELVNEQNRLKILNSTHASAPDHPAR